MANQTEQWNHHALNPDIEPTVLTDEEVEALGAQVMKSLLYTDETTPINVIRSTN